MASRVYEVAASHRSVRAYSGGVEENHLNLILESARRAPSAWGLQPYTITVITDKRMLAEIAEAVGGQKHVAEAPVLLVFSVDFAKLKAGIERLGVKVASPSLSHFMAALVDAGISAGWAALTAEDLGYGVTFIAIYSNACKVANIIKAPHLTVPVVGITIGKPGENPPLRPRQPPESLFGFNKYPDPDKASGGVASLYEGRNEVIKKLGFVLGPEGYFEKLKYTFVRCVLSRGYEKHLALLPGP